MRHLSIAKDEPGIQREAAGTGVVYLVGAGPGDPELLTLKAARLLAQADVVVYDNLVSPGVISLIHNGAEKIYVGKQTHRHTLPQAEINQMLVTLARDGKKVIRLKGGDPFIFGRGGEEVEHLQAAGLKVEVVNGITAGLAAVTSLGVPLTHRLHAHGVVFVTGHAKPGDTGTDWAALAATAAQARLTLVIYMGVTGSQHIQDELLRGLAASTHVAIIQDASLPTQRHAVTTLGKLRTTIERERLQSPSVIVIGDVLKGVAALGAGDAAVLRDFG